MLYHIPQVTGVSVSHHVIETLKALYPETIIGLKDSSGQRDGSLAYAKAFMPPNQVWVGHEPDLQVMATRGSLGAVSGVANVMPHLVGRLACDATLHQQLEHVRLLFMPIVNPGGMARGTRANPAGVDLMRNAPVDAQRAVPFMVGGHRRSNRLPWYRGPADAPMEAESAALCRVVAEELLVREFSLAIDCHSGFGVREVLRMLVLTKRVS